MTDRLDTIWDNQTAAVPAFLPKDIIKMARTQRRKQKIGMAVMSITTGILITYLIWQFPKEVNAFMIGLFIMIASMVIRIAIEYYSRLRKVAGIMQMDGKEYLGYLKTYYQWRKWVHYAITPLCFGAYLIGLIQLFPYFKAAFSSGFYTYLIVSAVVSLSMIAIIIIRQIKAELKFLKCLQF